MTHSDDGIPLTPPAPLQLSVIATCDMRNIVRGRSFPEDQYASYIGKGCGWVPANQLLSAFDLIASENPFGSQGDLRLMPDPTARTQLMMPGPPIPLDVTLADIHNPDGTPWECCARHFLKSAIERYEAQGEGTLACTFESEFTLYLDDDDTGPAFSLLGQRKIAEFCATLMAMAREAGLEPEMLLPEHGVGQFEITLKPATALQSADRIIVLREIIRELAWREGVQASFSPVPRVEGAGNGVHIHIGFLDGNGNPCAYDASTPGNLSRLAGRFAKGMLDSYHAVCAMTASTVLSYERLQPGRWSAGYGILAEQNREAALRICPAPTPKHDPARSHHYEFRAADGTACPYLALGALIHAGTDGLASENVEPVLSLDEPDPDRRGPASFEEALNAFERSEAVARWAPPVFRQVFLLNHRNEMSQLKGMPVEKVIEKYARVF